MKRKAAVSKSGKVVDDVESESESETKEQDRTGF